jgi:hypothetical protein
MSEWFAEGSGGFRPVLPLIAFGIGRPPHWISGVNPFLSSNVQRLKEVPVATIAGTRHEW